MTNDSICIVSPKRLENDLLHSFLEQEIGSKCIRTERIEQVSSLRDGDENDYLPKLILFDCQGEPIEKILEQIESTCEETFSQCPLCLFNFRHDLNIAIKAIKQGVSGFFYEHDTREHFLKGVRALCDGELWISREILKEYVCTTTNKILKSQARNIAALLTPRELEILALIGSGATNDEIGEELFISPNTVKTHIYNIFKKINVHNRLQATLWATENL
jgi:DNA-binding NarL/FixJ family response regulator